eukprot:COSAG03_NODE_648_length_6491_cov_7.544118_8_plen_73_part_00
MTTVVYTTSPAQHTFKNLRQEAHEKVPAADVVPELQQAYACRCVGCCADRCDADGGTSVRVDDDAHGAALAR